MTESALVQSIGSWLYDKKAKDKALADEVDEKMAEAGWILRRSEGGTEGRWIVMDYGSILVHIFNQEERTYYNLERLWEDGSNRLPLPFDQTVED